MNIEQMAKQVAMGSVPASAETIELVKWAYENRNAEAIQRKAKELLMALGNPREPYCIEIQQAMKSMHFALDNPLDKAGVGQPSIAQSQEEGISQAFKRNLNDSFGKLGQPSIVYQHDLYKDGDKDIPKAVKGINGQVVLALCKRCGRGECELVEPCVIPSKGFPPLPNASNEYDRAEIASLKAQLTGANTANKRLCHDRDAAIAAQQAAVQEMRLTHDAMEKLKAAYAQLQKDSEAHQNEKVELREQCRVLGNRLIGVKSALNAADFLSS